MRLLTNNPSKRAGLEGYDLRIVGRVPLPVRVTADNLRYLTTKRDRMGHDLPNLPSSFVDEEVTEASADALPAAVSERAAAAEPAAVSSALRLAHARALSPWAQPVLPDDAEVEAEEVTQ
jgi:3,4-dihydroxy 2-butanone 4-phosphate synthase/GTP cyclohydrolase II